MVAAARPHQSRLVLLVHPPRTAALPPGTAVLPRQLLSLALRKHQDPSVQMGGFGWRLGHAFKVLTKKGWDACKGEEGVTG